MFVVDASVWASLFIVDDAHHVATRRWLDQVIDREEAICAPISMLAELGGAVARRLTDSLAGRQAVNAVLQLPNLHLDSVDESLGLLGGQLAVDLRVRGADALYLALAVRLAIPLVTWDRGQRERGSGVVRTLSPEEAPADGRRDGE